MRTIISKSDWDSCSICGMSLKDMKSISGSGKYRSAKFIAHLKNEHNMLANKYFAESNSVPDCLCGCGDMVEVVIRGSDIVINTQIDGHHVESEEWKAGVDRMRSERVGKGNPMYGRPAWNKGKTKEDSDSLMSVSKAMTEREISSETKKRMSTSAKERTVHGHTGLKHSEESKKKMRDATIANIQRGLYVNLVSKPHLIVRGVLQDMGVQFVEEHPVGGFLFDFFIKECDTHIEVDGDYFHSNPRKYPDGPETKTQKRNWYRDLKKNKMCKENGLKLIRIWEYEIINDLQSVREMLECDLKK